MNPIVKICGLTGPEALDAALAAGADMVGLVRFERSPRHLALEAGRALSLRARGKAQRSPEFSHESWFLPAGSAG